MKTNSENCKQMIKVIVYLLKQCRKIPQYERDPEEESCREYLVGFLKEILDYLENKAYFSQEEKDFFEMVFLDEVPEEYLQSKYTTIPDLNELELRLRFVLFALLQKSEIKDEKNSY